MACLTVWPPKKKFGMDMRHLFCAADQNMWCMQARNLSSAMSAASSACDHIYNWVNGTPEGEWVSMGVFSDGSYNAPKVCVCTELTG